ncbi:MAG: NUMOD4 motif-containing HNH endonuclease [Alphaproteobacteria bacterium]|nr:NUMOD4 motif-containing HNH endonuclease [Alphaproteobacteria bacterium]
MNEVWSDVIGFEGVYKVAQDGRVMNVQTNKLIKPWINKFGYYSVTLRKNGRRKTTFVHRLIAQGFIPNPKNKTEVNHIDGNKKNNDISNLEWATPSENRVHSVNVLGNQKIPVKCLETGTIYESVKAAAKAVNGQSIGVSRAINGVRKTHKGLHWERVEKNQITHDNINNKD